MYEIKNLGTENVHKELILERLTLRITFQIDFSECIKTDAT